MYIEEENWTNTVNLFLSYIEGKFAPQILDQTLATHVQGFDQTFGTHRQGFDQTLATHVQGFDQTLGIHRQGFDQTFGTHRQGFDQTFGTHRQGFKRFISKLSFFCLNSWQYACTQNTSFVLLMGTKHKTISKFLIQNL